MLLGTDTGSRPTLRAVPPLRDPVATLHLAPTLHLVPTVAVETASCVCGHPQVAHEHYRPGSDCALCDCPRFRRRR